jgi:hypothetical protein
VALVCHYRLENLLPSKRIFFPRGGEGKNKPRVKINVVKFVVLTRLKLVYTNREGFVLSYSIARHIFSVFDDGHLKVPSLDASKEAKLRSFRRSCWLFRRLL